MRIDDAVTGACELWSAWDEDRTQGGVTARAHLLDDALDRIVWARDRATDLKVADWAAFA